MLNTHMKMQSGERPFICSVCGRTFLKNSSLTNHMAVHRPKIPFKCSFCNKTFRTKYAANRHVKLHRVVKPFCCCICERTFSTENGLKGHLRAHRNDKTYSCSVCGRQYCQEWYFNRHMKTHTIKNLRVCRLCDKAFLEERYCASHIEMYTSPRGKSILSCSCCTGKYKTVFDFKKHLEMHTVKRPFECSVCGKSFGSLSEIRIHRTKHVAKKIPSFSVCYKKDSTMNKDMEKGISTTSFCNNWWKDVSNTTVRNNPFKKEMICCICGTKNSQSWISINISENDTVMFCLQCKDLSTTCVLCEQDVKYCTLRKHLGAHTGEVVHSRRVSLIYVRKLLNKY